MICKICKKRNHKTSECFHKKNRRKNRKISFQNKAPKTTEPTKLGIDSKSLPKKPNLGQKPKIEDFRPDFKSVQNPKLGLKTLVGGNSLNHQTKTEDLDLKSKFAKLFSSPDSNSERYEKELTFEKRDLELANSKILKLERKVKKLKTDIKSLRAENLTLNILYFTNSNTQFFDKHVSKTSV